ncbi:putative gustatory receptor 28b [Chironomus tepperi]|uniref:putative gustatory receptor 28b n=1 Tax=Chironomus tepperi TaxID=113505 RepID=UPI00391F6145
MELDLNILITVLKFFKIFGFLPYSYDNFHENGKVRLQKVYVILVMTFLLFYWFILIGNFFENDLSSDKLTSISNWIQLLVNAWTLSIILVFPFTRASTMDEILKCIEKFECRASQMSIDVNKTKMNGIVLVSIFYFVTFVLYMGGYEVFVILIHHRLTSFIYWTVTFLPTVVSLAALCFSFCMLILIFYRIKITIKILKNEALCFQNFPQVMKVTDVKSFCVEQSIRSNMPSIFHLYQEILDLRLALEKFLGPIFLSAFTSIFVITTTQIYHCYTLIVTKKDSHLGFSLWAVGLCVNIIAINVSATIGLTTLCEMIASMSNTCIRLIAKMRLNGSKYFTSNEIQKMTEVFQLSNTDITFSAMGFFKVNYRMVCGMINSITTYLIIYIQFYALYANDSGSVFHNKFGN